MNKYEKALEELSYPSWESPCSGCKCGTSDCLDCKKAQAVLTLEELVEKATPKKLEKKYMELKGFIYYNCVCPNCGKSVCFETQRDTVKHQVNYCWKCGQALDWSEDDVD